MRILSERKRERELGGAIYRTVGSFWFFFLSILLYFLCFPEFCDQFLFGPFGDPRDSVYPGDGD